MVRSARHGFTIVELLIVIVVIGILAAITMTAFASVQAKARDSRRLQDIKTIVKALELYKTTNGAYPDEVPTVGASGWEVTSDGTNPTNFLSALVSTSGVSKVPIDPRNITSGGLDPNAGANNYVYYYHRYTAGSNGCVFSRGDFYVLGVQRMESIPSGSTHPSSPGFACSGLNWGTMGSPAWITGGYTNG